MNHIMGRHCGPPAIESHCTQTVTGERERERVVMAELCKLVAALRDRQAELRGQ